MESINDTSKAIPVNIQTISDDLLKPLAKRIALPSTAPDRSTVNASTWEKMFFFDAPVISLFLQVKKRSFLLQRMERHVHTQEIVIALDGPVIVPLAPAGDLNKSQTKMTAVYLPQGEGLALYPGTWHLVPFPLQETANVLVIFKAGTPQSDLDLAELNPFAHMTWD